MVYYLDHRSLCIVFKTRFRVPSLLEHERAQASVHKKASPWWWDYSNSRTKYNISLTDFLINPIFRLLSYSSSLFLNPTKCYIISIPCTDSFLDGRLVWIQFLSAVLKFTAFLPGITLCNPSNNKGDITLIQRRRTTIFSLR